MKGCGGLEIWQPCFQRQWKHLADQGRPLSPLLAFIDMNTTCYVVHVDSYWSCDNIILIINHRTIVVNPFVIHLIPGKGSIQSIKWPGKSATFFMIIDLISLFDWFFFYKNFIEKIAKIQLSFRKFHFNYIAVDIWTKMSVTCSGIESSNKAR